MSRSSIERYTLLYGPCWNLSSRSVRKECLLNALCCTVWSFVRWGVSLTRSVLESVWLFVGLLDTCWKLSGRLAVGEFLLHAPCLNLIVGSGVSLTRPVLESDRQFRSLSYTSNAGISLVSNRVRSVCYTPNPKVCLFVLLQAP